MPNTEFDPPEIVRFGPFFPDNFFGTFFYEFRQARGGLERPTVVHGGTERPREAQKNSESSDGEAQKLPKRVEQRKNDQKA